MDSGPHGAFEAESHLRAWLAGLAAAWNRGDMPAFLAGYWQSDATTFAGASGVQRGWASVLDCIGQQFFGPI
jgi:hypothetical protein